MAPGWVWDSSNFGLGWVDVPAGEMVSEQLEVGTTWGEMPGIEEESGRHCNKVIRALGAGRVNGRRKAPQRRQTQCPAKQNHLQSVWQKLMEECLSLNKEEVTTVSLAVERVEICGSHWGAERAVGSQIGLLL